MVFPAELIYQFAFELIFETVSFFEQKQYTWLLRLSNQLQYFNNCEIVINSHSSGNTQGHQTKTQTRHGDQIKNKQTGNADVL